MEKIDFVLPWVDGSDIVWQNEKAKYSLNKVDAETASARYRDMNTLKYVLRSIEKHYPSYNKIYLITTGHYPDWLNIEHDSVVLVTHDELYFNKTNLPIFSSSSIEMNLANLKDLEEKFVYLNDDMILMRPIAYFRFFVNNKPVDFLSHGWIPRNKLFGRFRRMDAWVYSLNNNLRLINTKFNLLHLIKEQFFNKSYSFKNKVSNTLMKYIYKKVFWLEHWHHPQPYLKNTLLEVKEEFYDEMMECSKNRFRANNDLTQYLYRYWHLIKGDFYPYKYNDGYVANIKSKDTLEMMIERIENNTDINFVCFNDDIDLSDSEFEKVKNRLTDYLESRFSQKASFEL